ncbi:hypothetical protein AAHA92_28385 [Salvia divinorum]|uniref:Heat shock protein 70 n=1 Tax=Salvia divinorum TaxID=28513 RepID=A0ABD1FUW9_SALDI
MAGNGRAIGIDLGTTYSCVAAWQHDRIEIIPNDQGNRSTPSCVTFTGAERLIGDAAKNQVAENPINTVFGFAFSYYYLSTLSFIVHHRLPPPPAPSPFYSSALPLQRRPSPSSILFRRLVTSQFVVSITNGWNELWAGDRD